MISDVYTVRAAAWRHAAFMNRDNVLHVMSGLRWRYKAVRVGRFWRVMGRGALDFDDC